MWAIRSSRQQIADFDSKDPQIVLVIRQRWEPDSRFSLGFRGLSVTHGAVMKKKPIKPAIEASPAKQLAAFIGKFDAPVAKLIRASRSSLRKQLPTAIEQVYDNYNFLAIGFCSTERTSDCIVSLAANAKGVSLYFYYGAKLSDPAKILEGSGNQVRFIRLESALTLARPEVQSLLSAAVSQAKTPLLASGGGYTMIKSISEKQRPRRLPSA
jgi:Domain of unknown function (DU1801)